MTGFVLLVCGIGLLMAVGIQGAAVPVELQEAGTAAHEACLAETGVKEDLIAKAREGNFEDDEKLKCYVKCLFDQFGLIEKGTINYDTMLALVPDSVKENGIAMVGLCRNSTGKDLCEIAFNFQKCFQKNFPEDYFLI